MTRTLFRLAPSETHFPNVFQEYLNAIQGLPIGSERLLWNREILREKDVALEAANQQFRDRIFDACWNIIDRYSELGLSGPEELME